MNVGDFDLGWVGGECRKGAAWGNRKRAGRRTKIINHDAAVALLTTERCAIFSQRQAYLNVSERNYSQGHRLYLPMRLIWGFPVGVGGR